MDSVRLGAVRAIDECQYQVYQDTNQMKMQIVPISGMLSGFLYRFLVATFPSSSFELDGGIAAVFRIPLTNRLNQDDYKTVSYNQTYCRWKYFFSLISCYS